LLLNLTSLLLASESPVTSHEVFIKADSCKDDTVHFVVVMAQWEESWVAITGPSPRHSHIERRRGGSLARREATSGVGLLSQRLRFAGGNLTAPELSRAECG